MKICCLIDTLNSGGAQRQMTWLVRALVGKGHDVRLLNYHKFDHYLPDIEACGVKRELINSESKIGRFWKFRSAIRRRRPDVIISFLDTPNFIGLFAGAPPKKIPVIVSERNHDIGGVNRTNKIRFNAFRLASKVVTNCYSQNEFVSKHFPFLKTKLTTILNCVDLKKFCPSSEQPLGAPKIIVAASVCERKNPEGLILASSILVKRNVEHSISWFGNNFFQDGSPTTDSECFVRCSEMIQEMQLQGHFRFENPVTNIEADFRTHNACCLPSFREGCPNVVCEAMASGLPVLVSDHGDMKKMVNSKLGLRFDPESPESIAQAIEKFASLDLDQRKAMGLESRKFAEEKLSPERFASQYDSLINEVTSS